jgi:ParB family chromosome partitioning protein
LRFLEIPLDQVIVEDRLREVDENKVASFAISMAQTGQITPIEVKMHPKGDSKYLLVAGAHRLAAAHVIGLPKIEAVLFEGDSDAARLREIDENLFRNELTPFDQANFLAERRVLWERLHGSIKRGGDRRSKSQVEPLIDALKKPSFFKETAKTFGLPQTVIKRALSRRAHIAPGVWEALRGTAAAANGSLLDKLSKLPLETQQEVLATATERGCDMKVAARIVTQLPPKDPRIAQFNALHLAWKCADPDVWADFLKKVKSGALKK